MRFRNRLKSDGVYNIVSQSCTVTIITSVRTEQRAWKMLHTIHIIVIVRLASAANTVNVVSNSLHTHRLTCVPSRQWRRQLWGTGAGAPSTFNNFILVQFGVNLTTN